MPNGYPDETEYNAVVEGDSCFLVVFRKGTAGASPAAGDVADVFTIEGNINDFIAAHARAFDFANVEMPNGYPDGPVLLKPACDVCGNVIADVRLDDNGQLAVMGLPGPGDELLAPLLARLDPRPIAKTGSRPWLTLLSWSPECAVVRCRCLATLSLEVDQICAAYEAGRRGRILVSELRQFSKVVG